MPSINRILFAVKDPAPRSARSIDKVIGIAKRLGADLDLFHVISTRQFFEVVPLNWAAPDVESQALVLRVRQLEALAERARRQGVVTKCAVEWDFPTHDAIVRRARRVKASLIVAECHQGRRTAPWLVHLTDWELLRTSDLPVLLLKNPIDWRERPVILAALDPSHANAKPALLDSRIATTAERMADDLRGTLHVMHANWPRVFGFSPADDIDDGSLLSRTMTAARSRRSGAFQKLAKAHCIPRGRRHLVERDPVHAIPAVARDIDADVVVMGAIGRSGLNRVFVGNTAERVLGALPCDVLVIKPAGAAKRAAVGARRARLAFVEPIVPMEFF